MFAIARLMWIRFRRLGLWAPALIVPLALVGVALFVGDQPVTLASKLILDFVFYALPALAILALITAVDRSRWDLVLTRPIGFGRLLLGIWAGGTAPFLGCHVLLVLTAATISALGPEPEPSASAAPASAVEYASDVRFWRGTPDRPFGEPTVVSEREERLAWLESPAPWTFEVRGVRGGTAPGGFIEARLVTEVGRTVVHGHEAGPPELYRAKSISARVRFQDGHGEDLAPPVDLVLLNREKVDFLIPPAAVLEDGRLFVVVESTEERSATGAEHDGVFVFWFERRLSSSDRSGEDGVFALALDDRHLPASGLLVVQRRWPQSVNILRTGLLGAGLLPMVTAVATFSAALFGMAVSFAFNLTLFLCGISMGFLEEVVDSLSIVSTTVLLGDPLDLQVLREPGWFDHALESFLRFWLLVLPDFRGFHGVDYLLGGEAVAWRMITEASGAALGYSACFLAGAFLLLRSWEIGK